MGSKSIGYWATTGLTAVAMGGSGMGKLMGAPEIQANFAKLGYPVYLMTILGVWMLGAAVVLLLPGFRLAKEWAYAGIVFAMTGAFASHLAAGDPLGQALPPLFITGFAVASYLLRPESRRLASSTSFT
jgi:hypothetical protein